MAAFIYPPQTYSEWLKTFEYFKEYELTEEDASILRQGVLEVDTYIVNLFQNQLVAFLNFVISKKLKKFNKELNFMIEVNDFIGISRLLKKLKIDFINLTFYHNLTFVKKETREELSLQLNNEMTKYFKDLSLFFEINGQTNREYINVLYDMKKLALFEIFKVSE